MGTRNPQNKRKPRNSKRTGVSRQSSVVISQTPPKPHRPTEAELSARIDMVFGLLVSGSRRAEICQFASRTWGIDDRQVDRYIAKATALIKQESAKTRGEAFAEHIAFRQQVRKRAMSDGDWRAALAAAQDEAKLLDLYPDTRLKVADWKSEFITLLRNGDVTTEQVIEVLGDDAAEIIAAAGVGKTIPASAGTIPRVSDPRASETESPDGEQVAVLASHY